MKTKTLMFILAIIILALPIFACGGVHGVVDQYDSPQAAATANIETGDNNAPPPAKMTAAIAIQTATTR